MLRVFLVVALVSLASGPTFAAERNVSALCRAAMSRDWPHVLEAQGPGSGKTMLPTITALQSVCAQDRDALIDLAYSEARMQLFDNDAAGAIATLDKYRIPPESPVYARSEWILLTAAEMLGDASRFRSERDIFLAAHDRALLKQKGIQKVERFETPLAWVDAYRTANDKAPYIFIASSKSGGEPASLFVVNRWPPLGGKVTYSNEIVSCWESGGRLEGFKRDPGDPPDYAMAKGAAIKAFSEPKPDQAARWPEDNATLPPFKTVPSAAYICANAQKILPAFADESEYTGAEYAAAGDAMSERQLEAMLMGAKAQQQTAANYVMAHPDSVPPIDLVFAVKALMNAGNMEKAAFWYYVYQIRIAPWKEPASSPAAGMMNEPFGVITESIGRPINEWAGSDFEGFRGLMLRASGYERKIPLYPGRPDGVDEAAWQKRIAASRASHDAATLDKDIPDTPQVRQQSEAARKSNGLYVGPWQSPGEPLPDDWR